MASKRNNGQARSETPGKSRQSSRSAQSGRINSKKAMNKYAQEKRKQEGDSALSNGASPGAYKSAYRGDPQGKSPKSNSSRKAASTQYSRSNPDYGKSNKRQRSKGFKIAAGIVGALILVIAGCGTAYALYMNSLTDELSGNQTEEEQDAIKDVLVGNKNWTDPFYMMLIGSDARDDDEEMGQRSDTNILLRVDPKKGIVTMISIPRDTKIDIDGYGTNKFNAAYNYGGAAATIREASQLCGVDIAHYAEVDFDQLIGLVDAIGGVEVEVPELINDPDAGSIIIQPGLQTLDGEKALIFARSRAYSDGDFTRTSNQRLLISAIVDKVLALPITELPGVIQKAAKCVNTDLTANDLVSLASQFKDFKSVTVYSAMVPSTTADIGGVSYVITDKATLKEMMEIVEAGEDPSGLKATASDNMYIPEESTSGLGTSNSYSYEYGYTEPYYEEQYYYEDPGTQYYEEPSNNYEAPVTPPDVSEGDGTGYYEEAA